MSNETSGSFGSSSSSLLGSLPTEASSVGTERPQRTIATSAGRSLHRQAQPARSRWKRPGSRIIAVGGGKGGVGKSFIASSLGIALARRGQRVVLVDADLGGANLHTALGLQHPKVSLADLIHHKVGHIEEVRTDTGIPKLSLVSGAHEYLMAANVTYQQTQRLLRQFQTLDTDFTLIDLGAGTATNVIDFFLLADPGVLVVAPEPGSVQSVYRFVKTCFLRRLWSSSSSKRTKTVVRQAMYEKNDSGIRSIADLLAAVDEIDPESASVLAGAAASFRPWLIVNNVRRIEDKRLGSSMGGVLYKHLGIDVDCLNPVYFDDRVWQANLRRKPYMLAQPGAPAAQNIDRIAGRLLLRRRARAEVPVADR